MLIEGIVSQEDRELTSSLGNWTGDAVWDPGPVFTYTGLMKFSLVPYGPNKTVSLGYPNLKIQRNREPVFQMITGKELIVNGYPYFTFLVTDGLGTNLVYDTPYYPDPYWQGFSWSFTTPPSWNEKTGSIKITLHMPDAAEGAVYIDWFSFPYLSKKPQYLPFVGIG